MNDNNDIGAFDWAALVPQGINSSAALSQQGAPPEPMRFDAETARALARVGDTADAVGYVGPTSVWMPRLQRATHKDFARRTDVRQECSTGCLDLQDEFTQEQARENSLIERARRQKREHRRAIEEARIANMDADARVMAYVERALGKLERLLNLSGGYARTVYDDLDDATDIIERDGDGAEVMPGTRDALEMAVAEADLHNWACWMHDVGPVAREALLRELAYRKVIEDAGLRQPYDAALIHGGLSSGTAACLMRPTTMGDRGVARSRRAPPL
ncbi:hypothetical protein pkur_cds_195 [Pandoravirus kuranda]|uniref:Uncharacterized protein n=1 Tax=Pandoravirus kuranda TaxID=3019033 RepID=A0AA95J6G8_9VIRU|nr:hypothetical protein pkur_cds_195 [Pandoravirus kuranda]